MVYTGVKLPTLLAQGARMPSVRAIPILLSILVGLLISLVVWGLVRPPRQQTGDTWIETRDDLLMGLLMLAAFVSGAFLTYVVLRVGL